MCIRDRGLGALGHGLARPGGDPGPVDASGSLADAGRPRGQAASHGRSRGPPGRSLGATGALGGHGGPHALRGAAPGRGPGAG
eukprot:7453642-Alexandrium_andersonii.AAC.1